MSLTYEVAVPQGKWPTFAQMNAAFERHGYPMKVLVQGDQKLDEPMKEFDGYLSFQVDFMGELHELDAHCSQFGPAFPGMAYAEDANELLEDLGSDYRVKDGDHHYNVGMGTKAPPRHCAANYYMMGVLVTDFDGYGYEGQGGLFGRSAFSNEMLGYANAIVADENSKIAETAAIAERETQAISAAAEAAKQKRGFPLWRTLAAIVVFLLVAEFIDKNIYNFTGTGESSAATMLDNNADN
ncbi:MAG: hypothetical protein AB8B54_07670 [Sphingorhabdus sp.]